MTSTKKSDFFVTFLLIVGGIFILATVLTAFSEPTYKPATTLNELDRLIKIRELQGYSNCLSEILDSNAQDECDILNFVKRKNDSIQKTLNTLR